MFKKKIDRRDALLPIRGYEGSTPEKPAWYAEVATSHYKRDIHDGRGWQCGCGACLTARKDGFIPPKM